MSQNFIKAVMFGLLLLASSTLVKAQNEVSIGKKDRNVIIVGAGKTLAGAGKATVIMVKETAKVAWQATKFTTVELAAPTAKILLVKAAPKVSLFLLKTSVRVLEKAAPIAAKLALAAAL